MKVTGWPPGWAELDFATIAVCTEGGVATVSVATELVALPALLLTTARYFLPLSAGKVAGVV